LADRKFAVILGAVNRKPLISQASQFDHALQKNLAMIRAKRAAD